MAVIFMILIARLLNWEDFESSGFLFFGSMGLIYDGKTVLSI